MDDRSFPTGATSLLDDEGSGRVDRPLIVLVAEDAELRDRVIEVLSRDYEIEALADGDAALAAIRGRQPDLILADASVPAPGGFDLVPELRAASKTGATRVILIAERDGEESDLEGLDAPADDYLTKPFTVRELIARVRVHTEMSRLRRRAEESARESRDRFERFTQNLPGLAWIKDGRGRYVYANDAAAKAFGSPLEVIYGSTDDELFPPETAAQFKENDSQALAGLTGIRTTETLEHDDGLIHHSLVIKFPIPASGREPPQVGGMAIDITVLKRAEEMMRESGEQFRRLAEAMPQIVYVNAPDGSTEYLNQRWRDYTGTTTADDDIIKQVVHPDDLPSLLGHWSEAMAGGSTFEAEFRIRRASDGEYRWFLTRAVPIFDARGAVAKWFGTSTDIDDRKRAEQRQDLLVETGRLLSSSLDYEATLSNVCKLVVPTFADWCSLDLLDESGELRRLDVVHKDPARVELSREYRRRYPSRPEDSGGLMKVLRSGEPEVYYDVPDELLIKGARDPEHLDYIRQLGIRSVLIVPLKARGRTLGALTLVTAESSRRYGDDDLRLATELGTRVALAVDNARLFEEAREAARSREEALRLHCSIEEQLTLLVEASESLSASLDMAAVSGAIVALSRRLVAADAYAVWRYQGSTGRWGIALASGLSDEYQRSAIEFLDQTPAVPEVPVLAEDILEIPMLGHRREAYEREGIRSFLVVPLRIRGNRSGTLVFYYRNPHRFSEVEVRVATALANLAGSAISSAEIYDELRANDRRKDEFLAMLAHELRNPLAAISNAINVINSSNDPAPESIDWGMGIIDRQLGHLVRLIDDLLDVSRITRGKIQLRKGLIDAYPILNNAVESVRPFVDQRRQQLAIESRPGLMLEADPTRLEQIAVNLLTNAAKYTGSGGQIWLAAVQEREEIVIRVRDTGIGIPPEQLPKMFELFVQGDRSPERSEGGLGIGLTLVQKLTEMHGGSVLARSEGTGKGSEFIVRLPAAQPMAVVETASPRPEPHRAARRAARILVVDDNVDTAQGMARLLQLLGHDVQIAHDGLSAIDKAGELHPEFVFLDIGLPGMDGYQVAARLRQEEDGRRAVIVAVSGYGQEEDRRRSRESGFDDHLVKPVSCDELIKVLTL